MGQTLIVGNDEIIDNESLPGTKSSCMFLIASSSTSLTERIAVIKGGKEGLVFLSHAVEMADEYWK
jgi:hypothetical protein